VDLNVIRPEQIRPEQIALSRLRVENTGARIECEVL